MFRSVVHRAYFKIRQGVFQEVIGASRKIRLDFSEDNGYYYALKRPWVLLFFWRWTTTLDDPE